MTTALHEEMVAFFVETLRGPTNSTVCLRKPLPPGRKPGFSRKALDGGWTGVDVVTRPGS
jgi:hypothetical protein